MNIIRSETAEKAFVNRIRDYYDSRQREGIHVSDLLNPLMSYWKKKVPKATTDREVGFFTTGDAIHLAIQKMFGVDKEESGEFAGIHYSIDLPVNGFPGELKGTRKWSIPEHPEPHYVQQCSYYCAAKGAQKGYIIVLFYCPGRTWDGKTSTYPQFRIWELQFTEGDIKGIREDMETRRKSLDLALSTNDPAGLPLCTNWLCFTQSKKTGVTIQCKWWGECKPKGRYNEVTGLPIV